jgi:hypothetical protein
MSLVEYLKYKRADDLRTCVLNEKKVEFQLTLRAVKYLRGWHPELQSGEYKQILTDAGYGETEIEEVLTQMGF